MKKDFTATEKLSHSIAEGVYNDFLRHTSPWDDRAITSDWIEQVLGPGEKPSRALQALLDEDYSDILHRETTFQRQAFVAKRRPTYRRQMRTWFIHDQSTPEDVAATLCLHFHLEEVDGAQKIVEKNILRCEEKAKKAYPELRGHLEKIWGVLTQNVSDEIARLKPKTRRLVMRYYTRDMHKTNGSFYAYTAPLTNKDNIRLAFTPIPETRLFFVLLYNSGLQGNFENPFHILDIVDTPITFKMKRKMFFSRVRGGAAPIGAFFRGLFRPAQKVKNS